LAEALDRLGDPTGADWQRRLALDRTDRVAEALDGLGLPDVDHHRAWAATRLARALIDRDAAPGARDPQAEAEALGLLDVAVDRLRPLADRHVDIWRFRTSLADALAARARLHLRADRVALAEADARAARGLLEP